MSEIYRILSGLIGSADYDNCEELLSEGNLSDIETKVLGSGGTPPECIRGAMECLRTEFPLDYDDLLFSGDYVSRIPNAVARNVLMGRFIALGNGLEGCDEHFSDATLNSVAEDYTSLMDLVVCKVEKLSEQKGYSITEEEVPAILRYISAIRLLLKYCWDMMNMTCSLRPTLFKKRCFRMRGRLNSILDMATFGKEFPEIDAGRKEVSDLVESILADTELDDLQRARNEQYKRNKIRLYRYTIRVSEELNNQLEACDPYDFTHRNDLKKQLEAVQRFLHSFEKDR